MTGLGIFTTRLLLWGTVIIFFAACSQQDSSTQQTPETDTSVENEANQDLSASTQGDARNNSLQVVPLPNLDAMESDLAALLQDSRAKLDLALNDINLSDPERAQAYANYGLVTFGNGLVLPAEAAFKNATRLAPTEVRWVYFLALIHEFTGALDQSVISFERVLELRTDDLPTLLRLGNVRFEQALMFEAEQLYSRALQLDPQSAAALYGLGRVSIANGDYQQAVDHLEKALQLQPQADQINYQLGMAWRNLGDKQKAQTYLSNRGTNKPGFDDPLFDQISGGEIRIGGMWADMDAGSQAYVDGDYALAVEQFRKATKNHPDDSRAWQSLGMGLVKLNDTVGAENAYKKALELSEDNAVVHHQLAKLKIITGNISQARQHLLTALEIDPRMLDAHTSLAKLLLDSGKPDQALSRYEAALELDPQSAELAVARAETLLALKRVKDAIKVLDDATITNPQDAVVRMSYGLVLAQDGQIDKAQSEISEALQDSKDDITRGRAHYALGTVHLQLGNAEDAINAFANALRSNPRHQAAGLELARSFLRVRNYQQALGTYEALLGNWPANDGARVEAAKVALMLGDGGKARSLLEEGASRKQATAGLLGSLARLLVLSTDPVVRDPQMAIKIAQRALDLNRSSPHLETLALCHAAAGRYGKAVELQEQILEQYRDTVTPSVWQRMEKNLSRYRAGVVGRLPLKAA